MGKQAQGFQSQGVDRCADFRLANGLAGDVSPVGEGVSELRIHYGPGYRVYFQQLGSQLVILLCGGDKSRQSRDIELAKQLARRWSRS